jgi:hypothetical protein
MEPIVSFETSVNFYHTTWCNLQEDNTVLLHFAFTELLCKNDLYLPRTWRLYVLLYPSTRLYGVINTKDHNINYHRLEKPKS